VLRYTVQRALYPVDPLENLSQPWFNLGSKYDVDGRCPRGEGSGRSREELYRHIGVR
jgi:hypothetical protein